MGSPAPGHALVQAFAAERPQVVVEVSMRRNLALALSAVLRRELDVAAGDVASLDQPLPRELSAEKVTGSRLAAPVSDRSELAGDPALGAGDLRGSGLWWPRQASSPELDSFLAAPARFLAGRGGVDQRHRPARRHVRDPVESHPHRVVQDPCRKRFGRGWTRECAMALHEHEADFGHATAQRTS